MRLFQRFIAILTFLNLLVFVTGSPEIRANEKIDFNRDIRPILSENCFHCHGPDAEQRQGDLRLDEKAGALTAVVVGDRTQSELFRRVSSQDAEVVMPPVDANRKLSPTQIELLGKWIDSGAEWGEHWSWRPLTSPDVPQIPSLPHAPVHNPIDAFIRMKLQTENLQPAAEADKTTLIRRVTFDLTGLPPSPEQVAQFLADDSATAYEIVVDRLLESPAYGERMAWNWLDAARYADSNGYQGDTERTMWPWRDWVVSAFNRNLPYDDFTIWQLAGDLLPEATFEQNLATGFCRNHMINGEGGRINEENRVDYVMDMAETTGTVWLGLTFNCCRCHDHKFDPLTQQDYYSLFAFFNQTPVNGSGRSGQTPPILAVPTPTQVEQIANLETLIQTSKEAVAQRAKELLSEQPVWEATKLATLNAETTWESLIATQLTAEQQHLEQFEDRAIFASGPNPPNDTYTIVAKTTKPVITALRLDALRHTTHTKGGLARSDSGNFVLTELEIVHLVNGEETPLIISSASATYEQGDLKVSKAFDGNSKTGWAVYEGKPIDRDHSALFEFAQPVELTPESELRITLRHDSPHVSHNLGRFLLSVTAATKPKLDESANQALQLALLLPTEKRSDDQKKTIIAAHQGEDSQHIVLSRKMQDDQKRLQSARDKVAKVMVMADQAEFRNSFRLNRGLYNAPGDEVTAAIPASLPPLPQGVKQDRLALARWLVSQENPLTARVVVNRFWQQVFGMGIVKTANDFGVQGEPPVHEELLNWLAADFRDSGWNVKRFMKQLVLSHTYRQSSKVTRELIDHDSENRLLARAPRYRLPSWMIRDQALAVSGLLSSELGGPSVNVYQPPGVWEEATFGNKKYVQDKGSALYRRSLYVFWRRIIGPTIFFDNSARQTCSVGTYLTNTPLHALSTFNDVTYVEAARVLAEKSLQQWDLTTDAQRLDWITRRMLARSFSTVETDIFLTGLERTRKQYATQPEAAKTLITQGEAPRSDTLDPIEHASWTSLCLALLNLDETLTKE